jgi:uncharacterized protein YbaP (TraB family)
MYFAIPGTNLHVLGSLHMFPTGSAGAPAWVNEAYEWCEVIVHEHEVSAVLPFMGADKPLHEVLEAQTWRALSEALPNDQAREAFDSWHPWAALIALSSVFQSCEPGVEAQLLGRAKADGKATSQLERGEDLCNAFGSAPLESIEAGIKHALLDAGDAQSRLQSMYDAWFARDRAGLLAAAEASGMFEIPALREAGLILRNRAWAPKIRDLTNGTRRTLVVVGAMHLCGPGNLEECLGVPIAPISTAGP